ncbi:stage III sporulation protein AG [Bacillus haynesii]|uniref:stage III sporulation protein AG n=1 Tax=Bacillus haynesii TaxID=1925021 RepID=UPI0022800F03|nr:stage III sporulation protein AG [Bacillus haynesii]MCY7849051.1 stage III sporulation protein AG [Bacillus haynesii]MCY8000061.1 stage III sporulation protein AG [Bacillus haynesii]MCY8100003.1 stage III sporulation protein AG [Bacillus haynesii]MCY8469580.1 stage III sporulation protein AG [Bacillus haynesii]MCY8537243.1 stage III sporulation protein AG [Bacillus haynesii]
MNKRTWIEKLIGHLLPKEEKDGKKLTKYHYFLLLFVLGVSFMLVSQIFSSEPSQNQTADQPAASQKAQSAGQSGEGEKEVFKPASDDKPKDSIQDYEQEYENQLKDILETIIGVEDVSIVVNVDATSLKIFEKNRKTQETSTNETDKQGGKRTVSEMSSDEEIVIIKNGDKETPVVVQTKKPDIRGVLVVAQGVDNVQIKKTIIEAVTRVLDVPSHRVAVAPKKMKEDS